MTQSDTSQSTRCDVCRLKAEQEPQSLYDVLCWLSPPIELIEILEGWAAKKQPPGPVLDYMERWRKLRMGEPMPELDGKFEPEQGKLLDVKAKVTYG